MLRLFKQNDISSAFGLVFLAFLLKARTIFYPPLLSEIENFHRGSLFSLDSLVTFYKANPTLYVILSICVLFLFSLYFNFVVNREKFLYRKSYLPAMSFLIFTSFSPVLNVFSTAFMANIILFFAFSKSMQIYHHHTPRRTCFDIGILVTIASLIYFPSILLFILFLALLLLLRPFVLQENLAYLLGILTPVYLTLAFFFLNGHWHEMGNMFFLNLTPPLSTMPALPFILTTLISVCLLVYSLFMVNQAGIKNAIVVRKKWNGVVLYAFFSCLIGSMSKVFPGVPWILSITPISILLSQTFLNNKEKYNTFTFYFLISVVLLIQWIL